MRPLLHILLWIALVAGCAGALQLAHTLKWSSKPDIYADAEKGAAFMKPRVATDGVTSFVLDGVSEDLALYLRFCMIPLRVDHKAGVGKQVLLISSRRRADSARIRFAGFYAQDTGRKVLSSWQGDQLALCLFQL